MPLLTFTPATVLSSGAALYSAQDPTTDGLGTDETPPLWPTSGLVSSAEVEVTVTTAPSADGALVLALLDVTTRYPVAGASTDASGVWSGDPGELVDLFNAEGWALDKFGGWRTDYLSVDSGTNTTNLQIACPSFPDPWAGFTASARRTALLTASLDHRVLCRKASWATATTLGTIISHGGNNGLFLGIDTSGNLQIRMRWEDSTPWPGSSGGQATSTYTGPSLSSMGLTNGQAYWFRYTSDPSNGIRIWTAPQNSPSSWTLQFSTTTNPFGAAGRAASGNYFGAMNLGSSSNLPGRGLNGDILDGTFSINSVPLATLSLDAMTSASTFTWTDSLGNGWTRRDTGSGSSRVTVTGASIPATRRYRIDFDTPFDPNLWRLVAYRIGGAYTIDEIVLDWEPPVTRGYRGIGFARSSGRY